MPSPTIHDHTTVSFIIVIIMPSSQRTNKYAKAN